MTQVDEVDRVGSAFAAMVDDGALDLPLPGHGRTRDRLDALAAVGRADLSVARLAEAHTDALAILAELGGPIPAPGQRWAVWAAEPPNPVVTATRHGADWVLDGVKPWCSGAHWCTHALLTVRHGAERVLVAAELDRATTTPVGDTWPAVGMAGSDSGQVRFAGTAATSVGAPGAYLTRPGFWHGAVGVAACWYGGATGVADALLTLARTGRAGEHALAHLGAVDATLLAAGTVMATAADAMDAGHGDRLLAARVRAVVEAACVEVLDRVGRATGAGPLGADVGHARRVADLTVYLRQSHAERDLAGTGRALAEGADPSW